MKQIASHRFMMIVCFILTCSLPDLVSSFVYAPKCEIKDHPYVAALTRLNDDGRIYQYASAVLITTEWLMTSKNMVIESYGNGTDPKTYVVLAGSNFEVPTSETRNQSRYIKSLHSFVSYAEAKLAPLFLNTYYHYRAEQSVYLIQVDRPFELSDYVQPVKLPPRPDFADSCTDSALIVGWGQVHLVATLKDVYWKTVKDPDHLSCAETNGTVKSFDFDDSKFVLLAKNTSICFCEDDKSVPVVCNDTLIGFVYSTYNPMEQSDDSCYEGYWIGVINISYHITFLHDMTGVEVAFESHPKSLKDPLEKPLTVYSTSTSTSTRKFRRRPARTSPDPEFGFVLNTAAEKRISCSLWMILTWIVVVFKIIK